MHILQAVDILSVEGCIDNNNNNQHSNRTTLKLGTDPFRSRSENNADEKKIYIYRTY